MIDSFREQKRLKVAACDKHPAKHNYLLTDLNILKLPRLPARLTTEETAFLLRVERQDLPWLVDAGILTPCGEPADTAQKWYATVDILNLMENPDKLSEMTQVISEQWAKKNARRKKPTKAAKKDGGETRDEVKTTGH